MESFVYYSRFVVRNLPSLEDVVIGEGEDEGNCFSHASLELKGEGMEHEVKNRLSKAEDNQDWVWAVSGTCKRVLIEGMSKVCR